MPNVRTLKQLRDVIDCLIEERGDLPLGAAVDIGHMQSVARGIDGAGVQGTHVFIVVSQEPPDGWRGKYVEVQDPLWAVG